MKTDYTLDTVGKFCPVPIIETAAKMKELKVNDTITVISDDSGFFPDMQNWCKMTGNEYIDDSEDDGIYTVYIRKVKS
jgi:tRNA 2-thiouridine synthesizing protein A